ncbi:MAG: hypothetical protein HY683_10495 [Chloroflexi bacterium]|nr:hypothetical protein [Chloroflexota bacterium]
MTPSPVPVGFDLAVLDMSGGGFSRTVTARLTNLGFQDATGVWAKVELYAGASRVKLSGQDSLRIDIGALSARASVQRQVMLSVGLLDGLRLQSNGARVVVTVYSDQATRSIEYPFQP